MSGVGGRIRVEVLGPLNAVGADGADLTPTGGLPRRLLALLVLRRGHVVSVDAAVEALWPTAKPAAPVAALQNHVSRLRRLLPPGTIALVGDGYRLDPELVDVDADRLASIVGERTVAADNRVVLDSILARWRGPAYPDLGDVDAGRIEAQRLEELRQRAREVRAAGRLAAGETDGLVTELRALADEDPLRERPHELLIDALATMGDRVEALRVYDSFRRALGDELGIEPSPALAARHNELLVGDEADSWSPGSTIPVPNTTLIGRDELVADLVALADDERVVTLVGPGGIGKTRLLIEVGHRLAAAPGHQPIVWCDLSRTDRSGVDDVITGSLRIDARPGVSMTERIVGLIGESPVVLLLDNCEHVLDPIAEFVARAVAGCPRLGVIATSRERLRVPGEQVRSVPPLSVSQASPAVELFIERARAAAELDLDDETQAGIEEIVTRLDGLPLAIELAAARTLSHDVHDIVIGLDQRFELLSSGYRGSSRHGSLAAAVSWSYRLLDDELQRTFSDLSIIAGAFDVNAASAVCDLEPGTARDRLTELVERSLVLRVGARRFRMLETLRAFGADQLIAAGREPQVAQRHARHLVGWAETARQRLIGSSDQVVAEIDEAVPELQRACTWLLANGDVERAGRLVTALFDYGFLRLRPDVLSWAERVATADGAEHSRWTAHAWAIAGYATWMAGDVPGCGQRAARALQVIDADRVPPLVAAVNGACALFEGRLHESSDWFGQAAGAASDPGERYFGAASQVMVLGYAGDPDTLHRSDDLLSDVGDDATAAAAYVWYCAAEASLAVGDDRASARFERALDLAATTGASFVTGTAGASKTSIAARCGDPAVAAAEYKTLIDHWQRAGMWSTQWTMLRSIAVLLERLGKHHDAAVLAAAIRSTAAGHQVFGADEVMLNELATRLRGRLGDAAYAAANARGSVLDGDAAVEHALVAL